MYGGVGVGWEGRTFVVVVVVEILSRLELGFGGWGGSRSVELAEGVAWGLGLGVGA